MIDFETAPKNAAQEIQRIQQASAFWGAYQLGAVRFAKETDVYGFFYRGSRAFIEQAHAPGGFFVLVDKHSGRSWTPEEIEAYYEARVASSPQKIAA